MSATKRYHSAHPLPGKQRGVAAVEFAIVAIIFFTFFFGIIELARAMYICNTLQEVTRRAAALAVNTDFTDSNAMQQVRVRAILRTSPGLLAFADPVSDQHVKIDYMQIPAGATVPVSITGALPASPRENRTNCLRNPNGADCIRLVRVRICGLGGDSDSCTPVPYKTILSLVALTFTLPISTTVASTETLGMPPGTPITCGC